MVLVVDSEGAEEQAGEGFVGVEGGLGVVEEGLAVDSKLEEEPQDVGAEVEVEEASPVASKVAKL